MLTTFFVAGDTGNDANTGGFFDPFATIQAGVDAAALNAGSDKVLVAPGVYEENVVINDASGDLALVGRSYFWSGVVIDGNGGDVIHATLTNDVTIKNLRVTDGADGIQATGLSSLLVDHVMADSNALGGIFCGEVGNVSMRHTTAVGNGSGAIILDAEDVVITHSDFSNNAGVGIGLGAGGDVLVSRTKANYNGANSASVLIGGKGTITLINTEISHNSSKGLFLQGMDDVYLSRTTANYNGDTGLDVFANGDVAVKWTTANHNQRGLSAASQSSIVVTRGKFNHNDVSGIGLVAPEIDIRSTQAKYNGGDGLLIEFAEDVRIRFSQFNSNGDDGIHVRNVQDVDIRWTQASQNSGDGIDVDTAEDLAIRFSRFNHNDGEGMNLDDVGDVELFFVITWGNGLPNYTLDDVVIRP